MSACIYHDAEAVTVCSGCDFGVCQACMDGGADGVCATCAEERASRGASSTPQETAAEVRRCSYCRAAEDDMTEIDPEGYCEACRVLPRCTDHSELIAVGHCRSCRQEYCRKCLGFSDMCQACTAKDKARPKPAGAQPGARPAGAKPKRPRPPGAQSGGPAGASRGGPAGARKGPPGKGAPAGKGGAAAKGKKGEPEDPKAKKAPKPPTRGRTAIESKLREKSSGKGRMQIIAVAVVGALATLLLLSGMYMHASSPEEQAKHLQEEMVTVHKAVVHYRQVTGQLPSNADEIYRALADMKVKGYKSIKVSNLVPQKPPATVFYDHGQTSFTITASDYTGQLLKSPGGSVIYLDQYFDSSQAN